MIWLKRCIKLLRWLFVSVLLLALIFIGVIIFYVENELPDVAVLNELQLQVPLRIFTRDGLLIAEYGQKKRIPIPFEQIPTQLVQAVLATEDQRFFEHPGVDILGLLRASLQLALTGHKAQGGSTITMQVARNFFLSRKKTFSRKLKEILLAIKIDNELSKQKILDLYLNKIYLGNRAYGVGAAAQVYFGKPLQELNLSQLAMIAGLPKAPSSLNPIHNPDAAKKRRNHVLTRMYEQGYINKAALEEAMNAPLNVQYHGLPIETNAPYAAEMVRAAMVAQYGEDAYTAGFNVYTTLSSRYIKAANEALREELLHYDQRHGYRGPLANLGNPAMNKLSKWLERLRKVPVVNELQPAIAVRINDQSVTAILPHGDIAFIQWDGLSWARPRLNNGSVGSIPKTANDILKPGDIIYLDKMPSGEWRLAQKPDSEAALIALNPQNGAIEAIVGGFDYQDSNFNRVLQAKRQAGSSFKPFIYSAALSKGFTLATLINDAPFVVNTQNDNELWRPQNATRRFYGMTRIREALVKSRNLVSIRLLDATGIKYTVDYLTRFGFNAKQLPQSLSLALGTGLVTPFEMANGLAVLANGGYQVKPYLIDRITNTKGELLYRAHPLVACESCLTIDTSTVDLKTLLPDPDRYAPQVIDPQIAYMMTTAMKDVINYGTARDVRKSGLERHDIAGKTGTTNDQKDAWFVGFNSDLVAVVWMGYDQPQSLYEYANKAALPMWVNFMKKALNGKPEHTMPEPPGLIHLLIDPKTGRPASEGQGNAISEIFTANTVPHPQETTTAANDDPARLTDTSNDNRVKTPETQAHPMGLEDEDSDDNQETELF